MKYIFMLQTTLLIVAIIYTVFNSFKLKKLRVNFDAMDTSLYFFNIAFNKDDFQNKLKNISLAIRSRLHFDFVSFFVLDHDRSAKLIHSNVPTFDKSMLTVFAEDLFSDNDEPQIFSTDGQGFLPHGEKRYIKYAYYVPLFQHDELLGCIILEKEHMDNISQVESSVFKTIISSVANAFAFLIFANNLNDSAFTDALTGIPNRGAFELLSNDLEDDYTLVMADIDHFKKVNDTFGHDAGDQVIKFVAKTLSDSIRPEDYCFRIGGEEFLLLLRGVNTEIITSRLNEIRETIEKNTLQYNHDSIKVTASFGISDTRTSKSISHLMKSSDKALYHAKEHGRNQIVDFRNI